ncbi:MAG: hypothetical protein ACREBU_01215 [Nitrososphaera sp.]
MFENLIMQDAIRPECGTAVGDYCFDFIVQNPAAIAVILGVLAAIGLGPWILIRHKSAKQKSVKAS